MTEPGTDPSDVFDDSLTNASGIWSCAGNRPEGRMAVAGHATVQGVRLRVSGVSREGRETVVGDLSL